MKLLLVGITLFISPGARAAAVDPGNPFPSLTNQSKENLSSFSKEGLSLVGPGFTAQLPSFSKDGGVVYHQTPPANEQAEVSRQTPFFLTSDTHHRAGEAIFETRVAKSYAGTSSQSSTPTPMFLDADSLDVAEKTIGASYGGPTGSATYSNEVPYEDSWGVGNGWIGARLSYRTQGHRRGDTFSAAWINTTLLGKSTLLIGANVQTTRDMGPTSNIGDDRLKYVINGYLLNQKTELANSSIPLGQNKTFQEIGHTSQKIFQQQWQYFVGPVPILISAWLHGKASGGTPYIEMGSAPNQVNEILYRGDVKPYATLDGGASAVLGGFAGVPNDVLPAYIGAFANVTFLHGLLRAQATGTSIGNGPCLWAGTDNLRTLIARVYLKVKWSLLQTFFVKTFVDSICKNSWGITIPGCNLVEEFIERVDKWTSFERTQDLIRHPGFDLGARRPWLDIQGCKAAVAPTVVRMCSQSNRDTHGAILIWDAQQSFWKSIGWYKMPPNGCTDVPLGNYQVNRVYAYAEYDGGKAVWGGNDASFCVNKYNAFDVNRADNASSCAGDQYKMVSATKIDLVPNKTHNWSLGGMDLAQYDNAKVEMCNRTYEDKIYTVLGFFKNGSWTTKGWFETAKDKCSSFDLGPYNGNVFLHANSYDLDGSLFGKWGRGWSMCVNQSLAFEYPFADSMNCTVAPNGTRGFDLFHVSPGTNTFDFTSEDIILNKQVCNEASSKVWVAHAWKEKVSGTVNWEGISGWHGIDPGKCITVREQKSYDVDTSWTYAFREGDGREFPKQDESNENTVDLCIKPNEKFELLELPATCPAGMVKKRFTKNPGSALVSFE